MTPLCRYILPAGRHCEQPAVRATHFCRHHGEIKRVTRRPARKRYDFTYIIPFVYAEDRAGIQFNLHLVTQALAEGKIDARTANAYTNNIRAAATNLRHGPLVEPDRNSIIKRVILTPEGDEIAPPREVLEKDESPLHYKDCPCQSCAEQFRNAPPEQHHADCKCGLCEPVDQSESQPSTNECHPERTGVPDTRDFRVTGCGSEGSAVREARAGKLLTADQLSPLQKQPNYHDYLYGDEIAKHEAQHAARVRAAIEAGLEPPEHTLWDISTYEHPWDREHREWKEGIDERRKEAIDDWNAKNPDQPKEFKPYLTWGEEHDLKLAEMKRLREQEEARGEDVPVVSRPFPDSLGHNPQQPSGS